MQEQQEPIPPVTKRNYLLLILLILLITVPVVPVLLYKYGIESTSRIADTVSFDIDRGDSIAKIAEDLAELGVIDSPSLFKVYIKLNGLDKSIQAGTYEIPAKVSIIDIAGMFRKGRSDVKLTFIEGWSIEEFAVLASEEIENVNYNEFVTTAKLDPKMSEGYLFPDTYFFAKDTTAQELVDVPRATFEEKTAGLLTDEDLREAGLTKEQAVIFASIVEREVSDAKDRPIVAGILIKRWRNGERLDADATTQYAIARKDYGSNDELTLEEAAKKEWWPKDLTAQDLEYNSPYNTRKVVGLPPTPISSFGLSALEAVIKHEQTEYNYYLTDEDYVTHYARTLAEHEANTQKYL